MYIYVYICIYRYVHVVACRGIQYDPAYNSTHVYAYICIHTHTHIYKFTNVYCKYIFVYIVYIYIHVYMGMQQGAVRPDSKQRVCIYIHIYVHIYLYICMNYIHIYIHMYRATQGEGVRVGRQQRAPMRATAHRARAQHLHA